MTFQNSELNDDMIKTVLPQIIKLNVNYISVVCSINKTILVTDTTNFGAIYYDSICSPMSLYIFYLEIYVRVFINLMKKILNI